MIVSPVPSREPGFLLQIIEAHFFNMRRAITLILYLALVIAGPKAVPSLRSRQFVCVNFEMR